MPWHVMCQGWQARPGPLGHRRLIARPSSIAKFPREDGAPDSDTIIGLWSAHGVKLPYREACVRLCRFVGIKKKPTGTALPVGSLAFVRQIKLFMFSQGLLPS